jgi:hypothetical protein
MGPSRPRNSTRARKAHPRSPQSRRKPAPPKRILTGGSGKKLRISAILATALRKIHERLEAAVSVTSLCVMALKAQAADHDIDIALCLECCVEQVISN